MGIYNIKCELFFHEVINIFTVQMNFYQSVLELHTRGSFM